MFFRRAIVALAATRVLGFATLVKAGDFEGGQPPAGIQEIVVTARHVAEDVQTTGVSVTVFSGAELERLGATNANDLMKFTPNLEFKANTGSAAQGLVVKIRGIGVSDVDFLQADPSVSTYVDGVFQARSFGSQYELLDLERIEILRGPQGTLYGKNSLGGAINFVTHKPAGEDAVTAEVEAGSYGSTAATVRGETSLIKNTLFASLAFETREHDPYYHNLYPGSVDPGNGSFQTARFALRWLAGATTVDLSADAFHQRQAAPPFILTSISPTGLAWASLAAAGLNPPTFAVGQNPSRGAIRNVDLDNGAAGGSFLPLGYGEHGQAPDNADFRGLALTVSNRPSDQLTLRSISAYRTFERYTAYDADGTPADVATLVKGDHGHEISEEIQANAELQDGHLELTTGAFGLYEAMTEDQSNDLAAQLAETIPTLRLLSDRNYHLYDNRSAALYLHSIWKWTERTRITAGLRYTKERKAAHYMIGPLMTPDVFSTLNQAQTLRFGATTPTVGFEHEISDVRLFYASASKGYASGGYNETPSALTGKIATFSPESLWSYEAGFKSLQFDRRLRLNLAAFVMNYDNIVIQSFGVSPTNGGIGLETTNSGRAQVIGGELEFEWRPIPALSISGGGGELHQRFLDFGIGASGRPVDPSKAHFFDSPSTTANVVAEVLIPTPLGRLSFAANASYRSRTWFDNLNTQVSSQVPCTLLDARLSYRPNEKLTVGAYVKNIQDRVYMLRSANVLATPLGEAIAHFGDPRTFGVQITYKSL